MKFRLQIILMISIFLMAFTELPELFRIPLLYQHFLQERQDGESDSILSFLYRHYILESGTDEDRSADHQLPFKNHENSIAQFVFVPTEKEEDVKSYPSLTGSYSNREYLFQSAFCESIWQPPQ